MGSVRLRFRRRGSLPSSRPPSSRDYTERVLWARSRQVLGHLDEPYTAGETQHPDGVESPY